MARKKEAIVETIPSTPSVLTDPVPTPKRRGRPPGTPRTAPQAVIVSSETPTLNAQGKPVVRYLNNSDMLKAVVASKAEGRMNPTLATMLSMLVKRYATKGNFVNYTYNDDMQSFALMMLVRTWASFDEKKWTNCFAYYTQCVKNSFIQYLNTEKKNQRLRDALIVDAGFMPSYSYQLDNARKMHDEESDAYERDVGVTPEILETVHTEALVVSKSFDRFDAADIHDDDFDVSTLADDVVLHDTMGSFSDELATPEDFDETEFDN